MFAELGSEASALAVAQHYSELLDGFILDEIDRDQADPIEALGIMTRALPTLMRTADDRRRLANEVVDLGRQILGL
jgi:LPPG:FO 2-phospho-L-lactate transferase